MREDFNLAPLAMVAVAGAFLVGLVTISPASVWAGELNSGSASHAMPRDGREAVPQLDESDERAALEAVALALAEVGDGATYVWHRGNGRLSGQVRPTASFKDQAGNACRHIVLQLTSGARSRQTEGIACRGVDGRWQLTG